MACPECGESVELSKSLIRDNGTAVGKSDQVSECPDCGADLSENDGGKHRLSKGI